LIFLLPREFFLYGLEGEELNLPNFFILFNNQPFEGYKCGYFLDGGVQSGYADVVLGEATDPCHRICNLSVINAYQRQGFDICFIKSHAITEIDDYLAV